MSHLLALVLLLTVLVVLLVLGAVGYLVHRHRALAAPLGAVVGVAGVLVACVTVIVTV
ncbi:hypothetical protein [Streptomyces sp. NPDC002690]